MGMNSLIMTPRLRKFTLLAHVIFSVGWLGSIVGYLALAMTGLTSRDDSLARSAYLSMELIGWTVIVPFSLAALLSGLVQSLGTDWGLFRHYWILVKLLLAVGATIILLLHMSVVSHMSGVARETSLSSGAFGTTRIQLVVHAVGGLLVLLAATALSIYKPWGMTPYGRRKQQEKVTPVVSLDHPSAAGTRRGMYVVFWIVGLVLLFLVLHHLFGGGMRHH
jgi:hypothetical protein